MLDANTFSNQDIIKYVTKNFIPLKINTDTKEGTILFQKFKGNGIPLIIFFDNNNNELDRIYGYSSPDDFQKKLKEIINGENTFPDLLAKFNLGDQSAETMYSLANKYQDRGNDSLAIAIFEKVIKHTDISWDMFHKSNFYLGVLSLKDNDLILNKYIANYPESPLIKDAVNHLIGYYNQNNFLNKELNLFNNYLDEFSDDPWFLNHFSWRMSELEISLNYALDQINLSLSLIEKENPDRAMLLDTKAEIYWKMGNYDDAIMTIDKSILIDPSNEYYKNQKTKFLQSIN